MKRLYARTVVSVQNVQTAYVIKKETPTFFKAYPAQPSTVMAVLRNVYWWLMTRGRYRVWCAYDGEKVIHTAYVIPKCSKFPFLKDDSYEIGPCHTNASYRGQGIYPAVLAQILSEGGTAFLIIDDQNLPSIRGALKAGFEALPGEVKKDGLKRFIYITEN